MTATPTRNVLWTLRRLAGARDTEALSDRELLHRFAAGRDEAAFEVLVRRHGPMVHHTCRRVLHHVEDAEDVVQATFLVLARRAAAGGWHDSIGGWLHRVALRLAVQTRAGAEKRARRETLASTRVSADPLAEVSGRELCVALDEELGRLPQRYREPVILCCLEGLARDEAAARLGWSFGTLKGRLERGRELLRQRLTRRGIALSAALGALALAPESGRAAAGYVVAATVRALAGAGGVSARVTALAETALADLFARRVQVIAAAVLALVVACAGAGVGLHAAAAGVPGDEEGPRRTVLPADKLPAQAAVPALPAGKDILGDPLPPGALRRLGSMRFRQGANIDAVAFGPDGKTVLTGGLDNTLRVWDTATGKELHRFGQANGAKFYAQIFCAAYAPDGKTVASGGNDRTLHVYDLATGQERKALDSGGRVVTHALAFAPDSRTLAAGRGDKTTVIWDVATGQELQRLAGHEGEVYAVAFAPEGKLIASASLDKTVRLWDPATGKEVRRCTGHEKGVLGVAFAPDGKTLASCGGDGSVRLWDVATAREKRRIPLPETWVRSVVFAPDGKSLFAASADYAQWDERGGRVVQLEVATGQTLRQFTDGDHHPTEVVALTPDGTTLAAVGGHDCTLRLWDVATGKERRPVGGHQGVVASALFTASERLLPGRQLIITTGGDDSVRVWDSFSARQVSQFPGYGAWLAPGGKTLLTIFGRKERTVTSYELTTGRLLSRFVLAGGSLPRWAVTPDGSTLAVADGANDIRLYEVPAGKQRGKLEGHRQPVLALTFSADGKRLASSGQNENVIIVWDVATRKEQRRFAGDPYHLAFSPDGSLLAASGEDAGVKVWEVDTGKEVLTLANDETFWTRACNVLFSPDGRTLATGSMNSQLRLWEVATGRERHRLEGHQGWASALAFSPDSRLLVSGGGDTTALVWDLLNAAYLTLPLLEALWNDLAGEDAAFAYRAILTLAAYPERGVPYLKKVLSPVPRADERQIAALIADLDSDTFATREKATAELAKLGEGAVKALRKALAGAPSAEVQARAGRLLAPYESSKLTGEPLRTLRAIEALERAGTKESRQLLRELAAGAEGARLTRDAKASLARLESLGSEP